MPQQRFMSNRKMLLGEDSNALVFLFAVNMIIFVLISFLKTVYYLTDTPLELFERQIVDWFRMPSSFVGVLYKPWTFIIHFFSQYHFWQLVSSMLWLWSFGYIFQDLSGNKHVIPVYIYAGASGAIAFLTANALLPSMVNVAQPIMGAGASVVGIAVATTVLAPKYKLFPLVYGGIPLWVLTLIFLALDFSTALGTLSILVAHIIAALVGFGYMKLLQNGTNAGDWMIRFYHWGNNLFSPKNTRIVKADTRGFDSTETKLNAILDKMNIVGYDNLSEEEKAFLKSASQE
jgi:membrane associated rhomboid family serine protease